MISRLLKVEFFLRVSSDGLVALATDSFTSFCPAASEGELTLFKLPELSWLT